MEINYITIFVTTKDAQQASGIGRALLEKKLVACANTLPSINSQYWWKGEIQNDTESLLILKSRRELFPLIEKEVKALHSYSVPEIIALPLFEGSSDYLEWIKGSVKKEDHSL